MSWLRAPGFGDSDAGFLASPQSDTRLKVKVVQRVQLFVTPRTIQFMGFSRPESWSG